MSFTTSSAEQDAREKRLSVVPYVVLALLAAFTAVMKHADRGSLLIDLALCALAAGWMLWMYTLHPLWRDRPGVMGVFLAGLVAIAGALVVRDSWFGFLTVAGYFYAFRVLRWPWELVGVGAVAIVAGDAQASGIAKTTAFGIFVYLAVLVGNVVPMCGLSWVGRNAEKVNTAREKALEAVSEANRQLEATLAENAGLHEQLLVQAREAGTLDERSRMAREIHDTLAQGLTGIITQLQAAEQAGEESVRQRRHLTSAIGLARESLSEARRSVHALRPEPLETARLSEALSGIASRWSALHGIAVNVTTTGTVSPITPEAEFALLRAAQEALANVARHSGASRVGVTLSYLSDGVAVDVRDDGSGFDPVRLNGARTLGNNRSRGASGGPGFGLVAMRQRIEALSGTLQIESEPGAGTAISASIPTAVGQG